jgi:hypothetical protein
MSTMQQQVRDLVGRWAAAEVAADTAVLDSLASADFRLVGPAGFVLDRQQWLDRYRGGDLVTTSLSIDDLDTRACGPSAITIGVFTQQAAYQGRPASGRFRVTAVAVRDDDTGGRPGEGPWRLAGVQLSPIMHPPAGPGGARRG